MKTGALQQVEAPLHAEGLPRVQAHARDWNDPLRLMQDELPASATRAFLWITCVICLAVFLWAALSRLDIIATADGRLVTRTLVKIVQPAESGVVRDLLVEEGSRVSAGQVLVRLDPTLARADQASVGSDLAMQQLQVRRLLAELQDRPMEQLAGDDAQSFSQVLTQYQAHRRAYLDSVAHERAMLEKIEHERRSALQIVSKLEQTLPTYERNAEAFERLARDGFMSGLASADKQRELIERSRDLDAQRASAAALGAAIAAQEKSLVQIQSRYRSELEKELADVRARISQLLPSLDKTVYRAGLLELKAPQDGVIKDVATTTVGAVVQPGTVLMTLVPSGEQLYADVEIRNDDAGFVQPGQYAAVKLAAYPFQKYGLLSGRLERISADANEARPTGAAAASSVGAEGAGNGAAAGATYKARIRLERQTLTAPDGSALVITPGMQVVAEIHQGRRTVLEYLLSPVQKMAQEAGRER